MQKYREKNEVIKTSCSKTCKNEIKKLSYKKLWKTCKPQIKKKGSMQHVAT